MIIDLATVTGADDTTAIRDMLAISNKYPFVEWGILFGSHPGGSQFPSGEWVEQLLALAGPEVRLSAHLCGAPLRVLMSGETISLPGRFSRAQLNWHGVKVSPKPAMYDRMLKEPQQWIFQLDGVNDHLLSTAREAGVNCAAIFDQSHGAGVLPSSWPAPIAGIPCTYAGGLSPQNINAQLVAIDFAVGGGHASIDIETKVRNASDALDFDAIRAYLQAASKYVPF